MMLALRTAFALSYSLVLFACKASPVTTADARFEEPSGKTAKKWSTISPQLKPAPKEGAIGPWLASEFAVNAKNHQLLFVYVGASWCEPCQLFKRELKRGSLDKPLQGIVFIEFDLDQDENRLKAAGYSAEFVPIFAAVSKTGRPLKIVDGGYPKSDGMAAMLEKIQGQVVLSKEHISGIKTD